MYPFNALRWRSVRIHYETHQQSTGKLRIRHHRFKRTRDSTVFCFRCWREKALGSFTRGNHAKFSWDTYSAGRGRRRYVDRIKTLPSSHGEEGPLEHKICIANRYYTSSYGRDWFLSNIANSRESNSWSLQDWDSRFYKTKILSGLNRKQAHWTSPDPRWGISELQEKIGP